MLKVWTGYKMRKRISKAIAKYSPAICTALNKYNELALFQNPPWPLLQYSDVASYHWLGNFDLKYSHTNIMWKLWTVPTNHEVANKYFKMLQAQEEIHCFNMEVRRLNAWVRHKYQLILSAVNAATDPHLAAKLHCCHAECQYINVLHWRTARWWWGSSWQGWSHTGWGI